MIECIFTLDYEIYGNGSGSLDKLVFEPAERLKELFRHYNAQFVIFVEVAELERIEDVKSDRAIDQVKNQIRDFYASGSEIGLHLHPHWYNARMESSRWLLDYNEYNLCLLPEERIEQIIRRAIAYIRTTLNEPSFTPCSFRNNNWLFQPAQPLAAVLARHGLVLDSSLFKGGLQHKHGLDYRRSLTNGYYWAFQQDINIPDPQGTLLEVPVYSKMVFMGKLLTKKRIRLQQEISSGYAVRSKMDRLSDFFHFRMPLKLDFCRMTYNELVLLFKSVIDDEKMAPASYKPIVAIGHTKDLVDFNAISSFLDYLGEHDIPVSTFMQIIDQDRLGFARH